MRADRVRRVEKVRLSAFRGWTQEHEVPLGADLVLVSAANGRGKSSLLEALGWALNGWPQHSMGDNEVVSAGRESRVTVEFDGGECEVRGREEPSAPEDEALGAETMRRATWFTQDPLDNQFETAGDGNDTLLGFLAPFPEWLERYEREVVRAIKRIDSQRPDEDAGRELASARRRRDEAAAALVVAFGPASSDALQSNDEPLKVALELVESHLEVRAPGGVPTPEWFASVRRVLVQGSRQGGRWEEALAVLEAAKGARDDFEAVWPEVPCAALRGWAGGHVPLEDLVRLLEGLARRPARWIEQGGVRELLSELPAESRGEVPRPEEWLEDLTRELAQVDPGRVERPRRALEAWARHWEGVEEQRAMRARALRAAEEMVRRESVGDVVVRDALRRLEGAQLGLMDAEKREDEAQERERRWTKLQRLQAVLHRQEEMCTALRLKQLDSTVKEDVLKALDAVMAHFVVAGRPNPEGFMRLEQSDRALTPRFGDHRSLFGHFSTGQKAQAGLAWLLGTNALLQRWLPHQLLLLDDLSTALDLTNLAAECALLRKFAYTRDRERGRQIILASHHDQLTNRIYDLMLPPEGYTMREVRLLDWSIEHGPTFETWIIKPTRRADDAARSELAKALGGSGEATR